MVSVRVAMCGIALSFLSACNVYDEGLVASGAGCTDGSAELPRRPDIADGPASDDVAPRVIALRDVVLDTSVVMDDGMGGLVGAWETTGFNLDDRCTSFDNQLYACAPPGTTPQYAEDGIRGVDNSFGPKLFPLVDIQYQVLINAQTAVDPGFVPYATNLQDYAARVLAEGLSTLIVTISRWNGTANDPSVKVTLTQSVRGMPGDGTSNPPTWVDGSVPAWQGDDWYWVRDDTFVNADPNEPRTFDDNAYVSNGMLVLNLPDRAELIFVGPGLGLRVALTQGIATGRLTEDGGLENVIMGGRWSRTDLLETSTAIDVCPGTATYNTVVNTIDNIADVRSDPESDGNGAPCDAVSFGVSFGRGYPARIAALIAGPPLPNPCATP